MKNKTTLTTISAIIALAIIAMSVFSQNRRLTFDAPNAATGFSTFSPPQNLGAPINSADMDQLPEITSNGLSLYFSSNRAGGLGGNDIYVSQRATLSSAWGAPQNLGATLNTSSNDTISHLSPDGREMFMQSNRPGGSGLVDIYISTRTDPTNDFGWTAPVNIGLGLNTASNDFFGNLFVDPASGARTLYFSSDRIGGLGGNDIYQSTRNPDGTFNAPVPVNELNSPLNEERTTIRRDGLEMLFSSNRFVPTTNQAVLISTRASTSASWRPPVYVAELNTVGSNAQPALSNDGTVVFFVSNRAGGFGLGDIYSAARVPTSGDTCTPTTTVSEGDLAPGGIASFGVSSDFGSVTVDHVNAGTGLQSLTVVGTPINATVNIPPFMPDTFNPITVTFTTPMPGQAVDFTLRAASTFHAAFIRVRCLETCTPTTTVTEGNLSPGGIVSFGVSSEPGAVTVDHVNAGTGLQSLTVIGTPTNAVVNIPTFTSGTTAPVVVTYSVIDPTQPVDFTLRAASIFHAANVRVRCGTPPISKVEK